MPSKTYYTIFCLYSVLYYSFAILFLKVVLMLSVLIIKYYVEGKN